MAKPRFIKRLVSNLGYKATALILACLIWYVVQGEEILEVNTKLDVRIESSEGFAIRDSAVISRDVTLRGPRVLVGNLQGKPILAVIRIPPGKLGSLRYRLDKEFIPHWDNRVKLTIHDPYVTANVEERLTKKLPVKPTFLGSIAEALSLEEVKVAPAEIEVTGARSDIIHLSELSSDPIDLTDLKESKTISSNIAKANLPDIELATSNVKISLKIGPKQPTKLVPIIPIEIIDTENVGSVRPSSISVTISAPEDMIHHINQKDIHAIVSAKNLGPGRYDLDVTTSCPEHVKIIEVSPKKISLELYNQHKLK
jgi:YbbR domain-containing protein